MAIQIIDDLSCIKVITNGDPLHVHKKQVKTIDVLQNDTVRIDIGEGALRHVYIRFADVTVPAGLANVNVLRDVIKQMLDTDDDVAGPTLANQQTELASLDGIKNRQDTANVLLGTIKDEQLKQTPHLNTIKDAQTTQNNLLTDIKTVQATEVNHLNTIKDAQTTQNNLLTDIKTVQATEVTHLNTIKDAQGTHTNLLTNVRDGITELQTQHTTEQGYFQDMISLLTQLNTSFSSANGNTLGDPSRMDESIPEMVYYGYAIAGAEPDAAVWAIKRIRREVDEFITEWADGNQQYDNIWDNHLELTYLPLAAPRG